MARRAPEKKFSIKRVLKGVAAGLLLFGAIAGGNYWYEGHPRYTAGTCLVGEGLYVKILEIKDDKYMVLAQLQGFPVVMKGLVPIRELNAGDWAEVDCETGDPK